MQRRRRLNFSRRRRPHLRECFDGWSSHDGPGTNRTRYDQLWPCQKSRDALRRAQCSGACPAGRHDLLFRRARHAGVPHQRAPHHDAGARRLRGCAPAVGISDRLHGARGTAATCIALHCEFDGNPNNSQVPGVTERKEIVPGAPGHCEGHNVNAAVTIVAALAIKAAMDRWDSGHAQGVRRAGRGATDQPAVFRPRRAFRRRRYRIPCAHPG